MVMGDMEMSTDLLVIGGGPGGYSAAFRGAELGLDVVLVDQGASLGGLCLHAGGIPSKTLLRLSRLLNESRLAGKIGIHFDEPRIDLAEIRAWQKETIGAIGNDLTKHAQRLGVMLVRGQACFTSSTSVRLEGAEISGIRFKRAIIATGSRPRSLPETSFSPTGRIMDTSMALVLSEIPKDLLVVGAGHAGVEIGIIYASLGSRVTLMEMQDHLLPKADPDLIAPLHDQLTEQFAAIRLATKVLKLKENDSGVVVQSTQGGNPGEELFCKVLLAIGRLGNTGNLGLESIGITLDGCNCIATNDQLQTTNPKIFAVGDVTGGIMLAHKAARQGRVAAEVISGKNVGFDVRAVPSVIYTEPQIAWCGLTEQEALRTGIAYRVQHLPRPYTDNSNGFIKLITKPFDNRILGAGIVGDHAEGLIGEAALAVEMGALAEDLALVLHPYPNNENSPLVLRKLRLADISI